MGFRKIIVALFACLALGAVAANAAQAAGGWTIQGVSPFPASENVKCAKHGTENLTLGATLSGVAVTLTGTGIECESATINNQVDDMNASLETAHSKGFLKFTGITVSPATCKVPGGTLTTKELTDKLFTDQVSGSTRIFDTFWADGGTFVEIPLEGAECPLAGVTAPVKGQACGEANHTVSGSLVPNKSGELFVEQILVFGMTQQTTGNSTTYPCKLTLGATAEATFSGTVKNELNGANVGKAFGADV